MRCLGCQSDNEEGLRFCDQCGAELSIACTKCGSANRPAANFCGHCAAPLPPRRSASMPSPPAERRQITVLFCDLVDSTALSSKLDPEDWRDLLRTYQTNCAEIVVDLEGYVAQYLGDGLLVYFGYPRAHEDGPVRAVRAALSIVRAIQSLNRQRSGVFGVTLQVRVGVHTGPVVIGPMGGASRSEFLAVGETPNLAARIQAATRPDTVVVSDATYRLTKNHFSFHELGPLTAKGLTNPTTLYEVEGESFSGVDRDGLDAVALTPLVGRAAEVKLLVDRWGDALAGKAPVVAISGEPGIGKSRLVRTLATHLDPKAHLRLRSQAAAVYQGTVLHPILELIEGHLGLSAHASPTDPAERLAKLRAELERVDVRTADALPLLAALLSIPVDASPGPMTLSPAKRRQATFEVLVTWVHSMTLRQPVLFIVEDLHWADPSTLELLGMLVERTAPGPLMIVLTHRPEFAPPWAAARLEAVRLSRLNDDDALRVLRSIAPGPGLTQETEREILSRGEGVPLYLEEIAKALIESATLSIARGTSEHPPPSLPVAIPAGVRDSFMARLDRLGPAKALLQLGATLGRTFDADLLGAVSGTDAATLRGQLDRLLASQLLLRVGDTSRETYTFRHALIQDAAYGSLLRRTRRDYHKQIAETLCDRFPSIAEARPEVLAHHYASAGMAAQAVERSAVAGQRAIARSAYLEAQGALTQALTQLALLPASRERDRTELSLRSGLIFALISTRGYAAPEVEANCNRASDLCAQFGDPPLEVLYGTWGVHLVRSDRDATARLADIIRRSAESSTDAITVVMAHASLGVRLFYTANYSLAREHFDKASAVGISSSAAQSVSGGFEGYMYPIVYSGWCDMIAGAADKAKAHFDRAMAIAEADSNPYAMGLVLGFAAAAARDANDAPRVRALSERNLAISIEHGFPMWIGLSNVLLGWAETRLGALEAGVARMRGALQLMRSIGSFITYPYHQACLAEAYLMHGHVEEADALIDEATAFSEGKLASNYLPLLHKLKGDVLAARHDASGAEAHYARAASDLRAQGARLFELQTTLAWARLASGGEGRARLRTLVESFAWAPGMVDVDDARALLATPA